MKTTINVVAHKHFDSLRPILEQLSNDYWQLHRGIESHSFSSRHDQAEALNRLGSIAKCIAQFNDAMNTLAAAAAPNR